MTKFIALLLLTVQAFAAGEAPLNNFMRFGQNGNPVAAIPGSALTEGSGATGKVIYKTIMTRETGTANAYQNFQDPSTGSTTFQTPSDKAFQIYEICYIHTGQSNTANWQWGISDTAPTNDNTSAPTNPKYACGANNKFCYPSSPSTTQYMCRGVSITIPPGKYIWILGSSLSPGNYKFSGRLF